MNKNIKVNQNISVIMNGINKAVEELGSIKDITVRTNDDVINLKETSSLAGYILNNYDKFKSATLVNNTKTNAVVVSKM